MFFKEMITQSLCCKWSFFYVYLRVDIDVYLHLNIDVYLHLDIDVYLHVDTNVYCQTYV